jgi:hypothetical protein
MYRFIGVVLAIFAALDSSYMLAGQQQSQSMENEVHINQIQVIGSHNSYHSGFAPSEHAYLEKANPKALRGLDYAHAPLADQLSAGVRQIEIDVFADSKGGRFSQLWLDERVAAAGLPADPSFDPKHEMDKPGFKVMHMQGFDQRSTCHTFVACLTQVRDWSKQHPQHLPIFILVETKEGENKDLPDVPKTEPFTPAVFDALDAEIRSVFKPSEIITPDEVRGRHKTLVEAVRAGEWPTLARARGRVIFLMDQKKAGPAYLEGHPSLRGRILFTNADPGTPDAAFVEQNEGSAAAIDELVRQGYLVRARSDEPTEQARNNDTRRRDEVLASGAQMISTDYPRSEPASWTGYSVGFADGATARCNPVNKPAGCVDSLLEPPPSR